MHFRPRNGLEQVMRYAIHEFSWFIVFGVLELFSIVT